MSRKIASSDFHLSVISGVSMDSGLEAREEDGGSHSNGTGKGGCGDRETLMGWC